MKSQKKSPIKPIARGIKKAPPLKQPPKKPINQLYYSIAVTGVFFIVALFGMLHHELWRDEIQPWLIARHSHSIPQLIHNMRFEGHPILWHLILYFITCFTHNIVYQQALHLLIACGFIYVFNRYSEIDIPYKILFSFGYFTVYEYAVISRDYGIVLLFIFIACALYKNRTSNYILIGIILAVLANISIFGIIFAIGIAVILGLDYFYNQKKDNKTLLKLAGSLLILFIGIVLSIYQIMPEKDNTFAISYNKELFNPRFWSNTASRLFISYFYIPKTEGIHFWNENIYFDNDPAVGIDAWKFFTEHPNYLWTWIYLPIISFFFAIIIFMRKPLILLLYLGLTLGLLSFYYYTNLIWSRYLGYLLIALIVCYWIAKYYPDKEFKNNIMRFLSNTGKKIQIPFLVLILSTNVIGAMVAYSKDYNEKFSISKDAADYIKENKLDTLTIVGATDFDMIPICYYLDTTMYYPNMNDYGSYVIWSKQRRDTINFIDNIKSANLLMNRGRNKLLLILTAPPSFSKDGGKTYELIQHGLTQKDIKIDMIKSFQAGIVSDEEYYLYLVQRFDTTKENLSQLPLFQ